VIRTRVGYTGGTLENPTYHRLGDHTETVEVDYDPGIISYGQLLEVFWGSHSPYSHSWSLQYKSAIVYHNEEQKRLAVETRDRQAATRGVKIHAEILPASKFYRAEDYHQKYYLRMLPELFRSVGRLYGSGDEFIDSTVAARLNGLIAGHGAIADIEKEMRRLGLDEAQRGKIMDTLHSYGR
jgi:peptide-methionine (S)-S-oxide reductase